MVEVNSNSKVTFPCTNCKKEMEAEIPPFEIVNLATMSMMIFQHTEVIRCPFCEQPYGFKLMGAQGAEYGFQTMPEQVAQALTKKYGRSKVPTLWGPEHLAGMDLKKGPKQ